MAWPYSDPPPPPTSVWRGIEHAEHEYIRQNGHILSDQRYCFPGEGTCFSKDFEDARSYATFGRTSPQKTGKPTYAIEVGHGSDLKADKDGYLKTSNPIPSSRIKSITRFNPDGSEERGSWHPGVGFVPAQNPIQKSERAMDKTFNWDDEGFEQPESLRKDEEGPADPAASASPILKRRASGHKVLSIDLATLAGQRVRVFRNLHNGLYSIQHQGRTIAHVPGIRLKNVRFLVGEGGRQAVLASGQKNVHAFVEGEVVNDPAPTHFTQGIGYNPKMHPANERGSFFRVPDKSRIFAANELVASLKPHPQDVIQQCPDCHRVAQRQGPVKTCKAHLDKPVMTVAELDQGQGSVPPREWLKPYAPRGQVIKKFEEPLFKGGMPSWHGRNIMHEDHIPDLNVRAATYQYEQGLPEEQAKEKAHGEYAREHQIQAAAHHLKGMRTAQTLGDNDQAHKHSVMYQLHVKGLGFEPTGPVPKAVEQAFQQLQDKPYYRFKAHKGDAFLLNGGQLQKGQVIQFPKMAARDHGESQGPAAEVTDLRASRAVRNQDGWVSYPYTDFLPQGHRDSFSLWVHHHDDGTVSSDLTYKGHGKPTHAGKMIMKLQNGQPAFTYSSMSARLPKDVLKAVKAAMEHQSRKPTGQVQKAEIESRLANIGKAARFILAWEKLKAS